MKINQKGLNFSGFSNIKRPVEVSKAVKEQDTKEAKTKLEYSDIKLDSANKEDIIEGEIVSSTIIPITDKASKTIGYLFEEEASLGSDTKYTYSFNKDGKEVSEAYSTEEEAITEFLKKYNSSDKVITTVTKAYQEGIYSDTPSNRKLGRVGMTYKEAEKMKETKEKEPKEEKEEYKVKEKDLTGDLEGFPPEIAQAMINEQVKQGNPPNVKIFQENNMAEKKDGGFNWEDSELGGASWEAITAGHNFKYFYNNKNIDKLSRSERSKILDELDKEEGESSAEKENKFSILPSIKNIKEVSNKGKKITIIKNGEKYKLSSFTFDGYTSYHIFDKNNKQTEFDNYKNLSKWFNSNKIK